MKKKSPSFSKGKSSLKALKQRAKSEGKERDDYSPFGMNLTGIEKKGNPDHLFQYNGKEKQEEFGLNWSDYGARFYDSQLGRFHTQDRFSEKYYDFTPYQYAGNNPVLNIDVNGDSILINFKKDKIVYHNGNLTYASTGKAYQGKFNKKGQLKGFIGKAKRALDQIRTGGSEGRSLVDDLQNDSRYVQISKGNENKTSGISIDWDPSNTSGGLDTKGSTNRPSYIGLAHEMAHANDALQDGKIDNFTWFTTKDGQTRTNAEKYATHIENQIRSENGLNIREYYTQKPYEPARITGGNTSLHIKRQVNLTPIKVENYLTNKSSTFTPSYKVPYTY